MRLAALVLLSATTLFCATKGPISGRPFNVEYDPAVKGIFLNPDSLFLVYVFDFWGTTAHQVLRGERGETDLFRNVLEPDHGRASRIAMKHAGDKWIAEVPIPMDARLLSWYVTDGKKSDYNDFKTYLSYVYTPEGNPVRGARFANVDFLFLAGQPIDKVLQEVHEEIEAYPDNLLAHVVFWRFQYFDTISPDTLKALMAASNAYFADFHHRLGDTLLNYQVISLNDVDRIIRLSLIERVNDPDVKDLIQAMKSNMRRVLEQIPESKRTAAVQSIARTMSEPYRTSQAADEEFRQSMSQFVGEQAPDFPFQTTTGERMRLSDLKGSIVLLDFWGTWCSWCVKEIPTLRAVYQEFKDKDVIFLSVSNDASARSWTEKQLAEYARAQGMSWYQVLDDPGASITKLYNIQFYPNPFLIGRNGKVITRLKLRGEDLRKTIAAAM